jgi:hypothetical protein
MLEFSDLNYWAIVIVWLIYVVVGSYWYSPAGFGKRWSKHTGVDIMKLSQDEANKAIVSVAASAIFQVLALAVVLNTLDVTEAADGLLVGAALWLGFTAATSVGNTLYQRLGWKLWWLNNSYFLLVMTAGSIVLTLWR